MVDISRNQLLVLAIVVIGLPALILGVEQIGNVPGLSASIVGSQLCGISADDVSISSNDPEIGGMSWVVTAAGNCGNHLVTGGARVDSSSLEGTDPDTGQEATAERGFEIAFQNYDTWREFNIQTSGGEPVDAEGTNQGVLTSGYNEYTCDYGILPNSCRQETFDRCYDWQSSGAGNGLTPLDQAIEEETGATSNNKLHCYRAENSVAKVSPFSTAELNRFTGEFVLEAAGDTARKTITGGEGVTEVSLEAGERNAHVSWRGSLLGELSGFNIDTSRFYAMCGNECANPDDPRGDGWQVVGTTYLDEYTDYRANFRSNAEQAIDNGQPAGAAGTLNSWASNLQYSSSAAGQVEESIGEAQVGRVVMEEGGIKIYPENPREDFNPLFTIRLDADWVGFEINVAEPSIGNINDVSMTAQESTTVSIPVSNNADVEGDVEVVTSCEYPIEGDSQRQNIPANGQSTYDIRLDSSASDSTSATCQVTAQDRDALSVQDKAQFNVNVQSSCTDTDGDGICNEFDQCIDEPGPESNNGCPTGDPEDEDSDGDGVPDSQDQCPNTASGVPVDAFGCAIDTPEQEICGNGIDDDGDGLVDGADPDCQTGSEIPWIPIIGGGLFLGLAAIFRRQIINFVSSLSNQGGSI